MNHLLLSAKLDISEAIRSRWFLVYALVFGAVVVGLFISGLTESRVMGFTGLSRLLVTYLQITMALLPLFVLLTTVRSMVGDRESGTFEYMLSLPVGLGSWFWGKCVGRFVVVFLPVFAAMALAIAWGALKGLEIPVMPVVYYTGLLLSLALCFLGFGFLISTLTRSTEVATGLALIIWLFMLLFLDLILLGILIKIRPAAGAAGAVRLCHTRSFRRQRLHRMGVDLPRVAGRRHRLDRLFRLPQKRPGLNRLCSLRREPRQDLASHEFSIRAWAPPFASLVRITLK
jgi:ABC-2 type transport system permease protein